MDTSHHTRSEAEQQDVTSEHKNVGSKERGLSIALGGLALFNALRQRGITGLLSGIGGAALLYRGISGHCKAYEALGIDHSDRVDARPPDLAEHGTKITETITINRPPEEVYRYWRDLRNLPKFMKHLSRIDTRENGETHWVASGPGGKTIEWDARIIHEKTNELIVWETLPGADMESKGTVRFDPALGGKGTELKVSLLYSPPYGKLGVLAAKLFHQAPDQQLKEDLRRLRQLLEAGELATAQVS